MPRVFISYKNTSLTMFTNIFTIPQPEKTSAVGRTTNRKENERDRKVCELVIT